MPLWFFSAVRLWIVYDVFIRKKKIIIRARIKFFKDKEKILFFKYLCLISDL